MSGINFREVGATEVVESLLCGGDDHRKDTMATSDSSSSQRAFSNSWGFIAVLAIPGVILLGWVAYSENVGPRDGRFDCAPEPPLAAGMFWNATVNDGELAKMRWDGMGKRKPATDFELGDTDGTETFTASVDGMTVTCEFRG